MNRIHGVLMWALLFTIISGVACDQKRATSSQNAQKDFRATTVVGLPETNPPAIDKSVADRLTIGMDQDQALATLKEATQHAPQTGSSFDNIIEQGRLSGAHYDVTIAQGNRKLVLKFKDKKLVDVQKEGLE